MVAKVLSECQDFVKQVVNAARVCIWCIYVIARYCFSAGTGLTCEALVEHDTASR